MARIRMNMTRKRLRRSEVKLPEIEKEVDQETENEVDQNLEIGMSAEEADLEIASVIIQKIGQGKNVAEAAQEIGLKSTDDGAAQEIDLKPIEDGAAQKIGLKPTEGGADQEIVRNKSDEGAGQEIASNRGMNEKGADQGIGRLQVRTQKVSKNLTNPKLVTKNAKRNCVK